jgi:hypothetical protein
MRGGEMTIAAIFYRRPARSAVWRLALILPTILFGCSSRAAAPLWENFSGAKAFAHVQHLVELGPRPAGSEALEKSRIYIIDQLKSFGWTTTRSEFSAPTPVPSFLALRHQDIRHDSFCRSERWRLEHRLAH